MVLKLNKCKDAEDLINGVCVKESKVKHKDANDLFGRIIQKIKGKDNFAFLLSRVKKKYKLIKVIGKGAFGEVYEAKEKKSDKTFAIKIQESRTSDFMKELNVLNRVKNKCKEYFLCIKEVITHENTQAIVMEMLKGGDLSENKRLPNAKKLEIIVKISKAVNEMHKLGIAHKDIKPANVHYSNGKVKLLDYGMSCTTTLCRWGGTRYYMHPYFSKMYENSDVFTSKLRKLWMENDWYSIYVIAVYDFGLSPELKLVKDIKKRFKQLDKLGKN